MNGSPRILPPGEGFSPAECLLTRSERAHQPLTLVLIDIDHVKKIDDNHGRLSCAEPFHLPGNAVPNLINVRFTFALRDGVVTLHDGIELAAVMACHKK